MDLKLEPMREDELEDFARIFWEAFEPLSANTILPMIYPDGLTPELKHLLRSRVVKRTNGDIGSWCFAAKHSASGKIVGVAWWAMNENPPETKDDIDAGYQRALEAKESEPEIQNQHSELSRAYFKASYYAEMEAIAGQTSMILRVLAVDPKYHRRGAASLLLRHGLEKADSLGLQVYLDSTIGGKPLYERHGFKAVSELPLNCLDYGGRSDGRHWCMLRPATRAINSRN